MAAAEIRRQLEALMASAAVANAQAQLKFTDEGVCRDYLCGLCPHDLYANTKFDLGKCPKAHNEHQKEAYEEASKTHDYGFEREWLETLERLLRERDKYIAYEIREVEERENRGMDPVVKDLLKQIGDVDDQIGVLTVDIEKLGEEGKVDESAVLLKRQEELRAEKRRLEDEVRQREAATGGTHRQKLRVCEVCGGKLSLYDSDRRLADHFGGKLHLGFQMIREKVKELRAKYGSAPPPVRAAVPPPAGPAADARGGGRDYDRGSRDYDRGGRDYDRGGRGYDRGGRGYDRGGRDYDRGGGRGGGHGDYDRRRDYDRDRDRGRDYDRDYERRRSRSRSPAK